MLREDAGGTPKGFPIEDGRATIVTANRSLDLLVALRGYQPGELYGVASDTTVLLDPYPSIQMRLEGGLPNLPAGARMRFSLQPSRPSDPDRGSYVTLRGTGSLSELTSPGRTSGFLDSSSGVTLRTASEGPHMVEAFLQSGVGRRSQRILELSPGTIQVRVGQAQQVFSFRIPPAALARGIEKTRSDRE